MPSMTVDIFSDMVCPWCWLGKRRLEQALAARPDLSVEIRFHAFQLDPTIPPEGISRREYMTRKFGDLSQIEARHAQLAAMGATEGLDFRFEQVQRSPNTRNAHRLVAIAADGGRQAEIVERLHHAYFAEGLDIGDAAVLEQIADDCGSGADWREASVTGAGNDTVDVDLDTAARLGIRGVPFFIFDGRYALSGAAEPAVIGQAMDKVLAERQLQPVAEPAG